MFYTTDPAERAAFIESLRQLADFLAGSSLFPVPAYGAQILLNADTYEDGGKQQIDRIARQLGTPITDNTPDGHYIAQRDFGRVNYRVVSIPNAATALRDARHSYDDSITLG